MDSSSFWWSIEWMSFLLLGCLQQKLHLFVHLMRLKVQILAGLGFAGVDANTYLRSHKKPIDLANLLEGKQVKEWENLSLGPRELLDPPLFVSSFPFSIVIHSSCSSSSLEHCVCLSFMCVRSKRFPFFPFYSLSSLSASISRLWEDKT